MWLRFKTVTSYDPLYFAFPLTVITFSLGLVIYWHYKRSLTKWVTGFSALAYFGGIALKYIVQIPTINALESASGNNPAVLGSYYGIQTAVFEVGDAFLIASIAL
ncbi:MAG: hypothetical protein ACYC7D_12265 [Nitrososphaerales archaeon]